MNKSICLSCIIQKLIPKTPARVSSWYKTSYIKQFYRNEPIAVDTDRMNRIILNSEFLTYTFHPCIGYPKICINGCKRIIGSLYSEFSSRIKEGGLAYIGFAYQANKPNTL